jgi:hypothetical protein
MTLETVLADAREDAAALRRHGHKHDAELIEALCDKVAEAAYPFLNWLSEAEARLKSGHSVAFLKSKFEAWQEQGLARMNERRREYRSVIIPQRGNREAAREAGRRAGAA